MQNRGVRSERDLIAALGTPLLAARRLQPEAVRPLARQLVEHWFASGRALLPVVGARAGAGRSALAASLATELAAGGARTLLIDADFRAPSQHRRFATAREGGFADFLGGRGMRLAACRDNLAVLAAGRVRDDPLELLSRARLQSFVRAAARQFDAVLVDTPAAERGPDLEMFAALAGGALLVVRPGEDARRLVRLRSRLARVRARVVATVFSAP
jgi:Mrp family chromosome partitioning ATPase